VLLPHISLLPAWITATFVVLALWRIGNAVHGIGLPPRWLRVALSIAIIAGVFASYGTLLGRQAGVAALAALAGLKLVESERKRDAYVAVFLGCFLMVTGFLFSQTAMMGIYMLLAVVVFVATLVVVNTPSEECPLRRRFKLALTLTAQAIPVMIVLFVLYPRVPGPLWGLPKDAHNAVTGLSETMRPGAISELSRSSEVAFRVSFENETPASNQLYWRGPVLWDNDGQEWSSEPPELRRFTPPAERLGRPVEYTISLEPSQNKRIFALDLLDRLPYGYRISDDFQVFSGLRVRARKNLRMRSYPDYRISTLSTTDRKRALGLPEGAHPEARRLARGWRAQNLSDQAVVQSALAYFNEQPFYYTLQPPLLEKDTIDEFLFTTRQGFCEHFAAAFTVLMRAAGIPTRVVTGYQGGEPNPLGNYLIVRQRDAHAWAEVWLHGEGWVRIDPTAAVAPQRIIEGIDAVMPARTGPALLGIAPSSGVARAWKRARLVLETANHAWNQWVIGYGPRRQQLFLKHFGFGAKEWSTLVFALVALVTTLITALAVWMHKQAAPSDPVIRAYQRFCRKLARRGFTRHPNEGPCDFCARVAAKRPELAPQVERLTELYVQLRYAGSTEDTRAFAHGVAHFRP
jgi:transglutaminase-like putative cysteine protease